MFTINLTITTKIIEGTCKPENDANGMSIVACGLVAWSLFNNTYTFSKGNNNESLPVNKRHISSKSDRDHKFGSDVFPIFFQNGSLIGGARLNESIPTRQTVGSVALVGCRNQHVTFGCFRLYLLLDVGKWVI